MTTNTRQTDNNHPRWYLIWKDKIQIQIWTCIDHDDQLETAHPLEMTSPGTRTQTHKKEQHTWKTKHLTQSTDRYRTTRQTPPQDKPQPCISRRRWRHIPDQVCIHMTHRTNTSTYFTPFHCNHLHHWHWQKIYKTDIGTNLDTWQQASIHIFLTSLLWLYKASLPE